MGPTFWPFIAMHTTSSDSLSMADGISPLNFRAATEAVAEHDWDPCLVVEELGRRDQEGPAVCRDNITYLQAGKRMRPAPLTDLRWHGTTTEGLFEQK